MRVARPAAVAIEFDTFRVAVGLAVISGALAVLAPYLNSLTGALAALALSGWVAGRSLELGGWAGHFTFARGVGLVTIGLGAVAFFLLPGPVGSLRALALALSFVPLWLVERRPSIRAAALPRGNP